MRRLRDLLHALLAPYRGLVALCRLPSQLTQWRVQLQTQDLLIREQNDLLRELLMAIGHGPSQIPETPRLVPPFGAMPPAGSTDTTVPLQSVPPPEPPNPHRLRTARDVTYSSRQFLRDQDERAVAAQAPWRTPGA